MIGRCGRLSWLTAFVLTLGADTVAGRCRRRRGRCGSAGSALRIAASELRPSGGGLGRRADQRAGRRRHRFAQRRRRPQAELRLSGDRDRAGAGGTELDIVRLDGDAAQIAVTERARRRVARPPERAARLSRSTRRRSLAPSSDDSPPGQLRDRFQRPGCGSAGLDRGLAFGAWWRARASDPAPIDHVAAAIPGAEALAGQRRLGHVRRRRAESGIRRTCRPTGRPIATAAGATCRPGAGPGSTTRRGASRRAITAAGRGSTTAGAGCPAPATRRRSTAPRPSRFSARPASGFSYAGAIGAGGRLVPARARQRSSDPDAHTEPPFASAVPRAVFTGGKPVAEALVDIPDAATRRCAAACRAAERSRHPGRPRPRPDRRACRHAGDRAAPRRRRGRVIALDTPTRAVKERITRQARRAAAPCGAHRRRGPTWRARLFVWRSRRRVRRTMRRHIADARRIVRADNPDRDPRR